MERPKNFSEKPPEDESNEKTIEAYQALTSSYHSKFQELQRLDRRFPGAVDSEVTSARQVIDDQRHQLHGNLLELGEKLGKTKEDVLVDIIRKNGTLEEYGLPEFSVLTADDIVIDKSEDREDMFFNVTFDDSTKPGRPAKRGEGNPSNHPKGEEWQNRLKPEEMMIVFSIVPVDYFSDGDWDQYAPDDYEERAKRARALAEEVNGEVFEEFNSGYHDVYAKILGVTIPKNDVGKVTDIIRRNPQKYRLGKEFYQTEQDE